MSKVRREKKGRGGFLMRTHIFSGLLVAFAIGGAAFLSPATDMRAEADTIDFAKLHNQATSAMHELQASQERCMAALQTGEFEF